MKVSFLPETMVFEGELSEFCDLTQLVKSYQDFKNKSGAQKIKLDFSKVKRANSTGIVIWLKFFQQCEDHFEYVNCPVWLVNQFNMITDFLGTRSTVESIQAPFFCEETESSQNFKMVITKEIPLLDSYSEFKIENRKIEGKEFEPDFDPESYFDFITQIKDRYR